MSSDIRIQKGNPKVFNVKFTYKKSGEPLSLSEIIVLFTVKNINDYTDDDDKALITKDIEVHNDELNGETQLILTAEDTSSIPVGVYKYDFRCYKKNEIQINTVSGKIYIDDIVTKRTTEEEDENE